MADDRWAEFMKESGDFGDVDNFDLYAPSDATLIQKSKKETRQKSKKEPPPQAPPATAADITSKQVSAPKPNFEFTKALQKLHTQSGDEPDMLEGFDLSTLKNEDAADDVDADAAIRAILFKTEQEPAQQREMVNKEVEDMAQPVHALPPIEENLNFIEIKKEPGRGMQLSAPQKVLQSGQTFVKHEVSANKELQLSIQGSSLAPDTRWPTTVGQLQPQDFYWFDAKEQPYTYASDPGSVFLFGKVSVVSQQDGTAKGFESCCVRVNNMYRSFLFLPKDQSDADPALNEINDYCRDAGIANRRLRAVERYYAFEDPKIPREKKTWIKLKYSATNPPLALDGKTWQHVIAVLGGSRSLVELLLVKRKIKGPGFLKISSLVAVRPQQKLSHCRWEFSTDSPKNVHPAEGGVCPLFKGLSIQLTTSLTEDQSHNEIHAIALTYCSSMVVDGGNKALPPCEYRLAVRPFSSSVPLPFDLELACNNKGLSHVTKAANEAALLQWFTDRIAEYDPDFLIGHNILAYTLDVLLHRYQELHVPGWSLLGRLDLRRMPKLQSGVGGSTESTVQEKEVCVGRLICDSYLLSREYYKSSNYKLLHLSYQMKLSGAFGIVDESMAESPVPLITKAAMGESQKIFSLLTYSLNLSLLSIAVTYSLDAIPLTKRLCGLAGNLWARVLCGSRAERIEYLLLHAFHAAKFVTPDRNVPSYKTKRDDDGDDEEESARPAAKYKGGMVLDPISGLYSEFILLMDFNSLYPSLIQEFNICFTTVARGVGITEPQVPPPESLVCESCASVGAPSPCPHKCILPRVIRGLVQSRREVKKLMKSEKDPIQLAQLDIRQRALKLTANSMYGCLGFQYSRFFAQPLAELVTKQGRLALMNTVELVPTINPSLRVIYGDTDSVMIQTGVRDDLKMVRDLGMEIKSKVNKRYQSLEIDIDGVFRSILLMKKKKYAALAVVDWEGAGTTLKQEVKGLDMVRRDWCPLSHEASKVILERVLTAESSEDVLEFVARYMQTLSQKAREGTHFELSQYVISKSLTKDPHLYKGAQFPHATVALRMQERNEPVRVGDLIPYVICLSEGHSSSQLSQRAFHVEEVKNSSRQLDVEWYLETQIYPPVLRICMHIQGFSAAHLSEAMGLKVEQQQRQRNSDSEINLTNSFKSSNAEDCFPLAQPFSVFCFKCNSISVVQPHKRVIDFLQAEHRAYGPHPRSLPFYLYACEGCSEALPLNYLVNCFITECFRYLRGFYERGGSEQEAAKLRQQLLYFRAIFDIPRYPGVDPEVVHAHSVRARRLHLASGLLGTFSDAQREGGTNPVADPILDYISTVCDRVSHLFVPLGDLFSQGFPKSFKS